VSIFSLLVSFASCCRNPDAGSVESLRVRKKAATRRLLGGEIAGARALKSSHHSASGFPYHSSTAA
jgi:hypothetical protein